MCLILDLADRFKTQSYGCLFTGKKMMYVIGSLFSFSTCLRARGDSNLSIDKQVFSYISLMEETGATFFLNESQIPLLKLYIKLFYLKCTLLPIRILCVYRLLT